MIIHTHAYARAGLIGNPSDGYFGKTISVIVQNYKAEVICYESPRLEIRPQHSDRLVFERLDDLVDDVYVNGYYGGVRLIKATIKRFHDYCREHGQMLPPWQFTIEYRTDIPIRVGLAGSSGIITAVMRALMKFFQIDIPKPELPGVILSVELDELGISAGLQDRVIQIYEGAVFMDFDREHLETKGHGIYESLDPSNLPPLFVAYHSHLSEGTEVTHNSLRDRWNREEKQVVEAMGQFADLAERCRELIQSGRGEEIAPLMNDNFNLRASLVQISPGNQMLIDIARRYGCAVKFAGSGGAVIGVYDGDPARLRRMRQDYEAFGAELIEPQIGDCS